MKAISSFTVKNSCQGRAILVCSGRFTISFLLLLQAAGGNGLQGFNAAFILPEEGAWPPRIAALGISGRVDEAVIDAGAPAPFWWMKFR